MGTTKLILLDSLLQENLDCVVLVGPRFLIKVSSIAKLKSKRKMSEIISNENKLSMLINDTMEAMAEVSACKSKASCISLDAGPLQRV